KTTARCCCYKFTPLPPQTLTIIAQFNPRVHRSHSVYTSLKFTRTDYFYYNIPTTTVVYKATSVSVVALFLIFLNTFIITQPLTTAHTLCSIEIRDNIIHY